mmetsp:Transcript_45961/g.74969  ORF Transcript_45961/g.74969 Transcript_45961/m.74969 type:complete len:250 (-) Transcript_45961:356-1105(-)
MIATVIDTYDALSLLSSVVGWLYFSCWSISFYPQIILNWRAKSVAGLSFDFIFLNLTGHISYLVFNASHYAKCPDKNECIVQIHDVLFSVHSVFLVLLCIAQTFIYENGKQSVSIVVRAILGLLWLSIGAGIALVITEAVDWLEFTSYLGNVKLFCSFVKYAPQAYMNYQRKSTAGFSIAYIFLDAGGAIFSETQIAVDSLRLGRMSLWRSNIPKTFLGIECMSFDTLFILQRYVFYPQYYETIDMIIE